MINQLSFDFRSIRRVTEKKVFGVNDKGRKKGRKERLSFCYRILEKRRQG